VNGTSAAVVSAPVRTVRVAFIGNPNTGKTTLFNALCGTRARTSNYPGTTTTIRTGTLDQHDHIQVVDVPGLYDLHHNTPEMRVAHSVLDAAGPAAVDIVVIALDAANLTRNLVLAAEVLACERPVVVALNMMDLARRRGLALDPDALSRRLGVPVIPLVARDNHGIDRLRQAIADAAESAAAPLPADLPRGTASLEVLTDWAERVSQSITVETRPASHDTWTERLDVFFTHPVAGMLAFVGIMCVLFWALFTLAAVPMDLIEAVFGRFATLLESALPPGPVRDLIANGIVGGIAGTIVFLPQICLLFFLISLLEDTGYLARAAFVMDGVLSRFGLPGHAFVPLLTSHACAIPGIMSARLIPDQRDRLATILVAPFMSCSARLPVYVLLISLLFAGNPVLAGMAFAGCYLLGASAGLFTAWIFKRTVLKGHSRPMVLELPSYRRPSLTNALLTAKDQGAAFLRTAGTIIVAICVVMWWLSAYPRVGATREADALRARVGESATQSQTEALLTEADAIDARAAQAGSFAGQLGHVIEPVFKPLGFDWQLTVGIVTSFLAREVFVSTMSVLEGGVGGADDDGVVDRIRQMKRDDGTPVFTPSTAAAALIFFVLAMQCLPTLTVTRKETGSVKYAAMQFGYMSGLAYVAALVTYAVVRAAGVP
jgi:ferrous iron transport protein B